MLAPLRPPPKNPLQYPVHSRAYQSISDNEPQSNKGTSPYEAKEKKGEKYGYINNDGQSSNTGLTEHMSRESPNGAPRFSPYKKALEGDKDGERSNIAKTGPSCSVVLR